MAITTSTNGGTLPGMERTALLLALTLAACSGDDDTTTADASAEIDESGLGHWTIEADLGACDRGTETLELWMVESQPGLPYSVQVVGHTLERAGMSLYGGAAHFVVWIADLNEGWSGVVGPGVDPEVTFEADGCRAEGVAVSAEEI